MTERFTGSFTQQLPLPEAAIRAAETVLRHGRLHRYNIADGETPEATLLEQEFAAWLGADHCLALASGGQAMAIALRAAGVAPGDTVLTNAFTLAPVPGAVAAVGAKSAFVQTREDLTIDLDHLDALIAETGSKVLLLSHMRGHICDMYRLMALCQSAGVLVIEDCAHTMGASWDGTKSGLFGEIACYSTQTYKHMNSGEGGFLTTNNPDIAARAILMSGSYMLYDRNGTAPGAEHFEGAKYDAPNMSARMDNLRAAILRPQLTRLDADCAAWTARYRAVEVGLRDVPGLTLIERPAQEDFVGSSFQFRLPDLSDYEIEAFVDACRARGVELKWFGAAAPAGFTSTYAHWHYASPFPLPETDSVLASLLDMRIPLTFSLDDCAIIARIIADEARKLAKAMTQA
ncbi:MAG: DegT/DnrJ/EryC1/StrS family aminotransferase [Pseudomonadota bacterium]